jgi:hypothetical protein
MFGSGKKYACVRNPKSGAPKLTKKGKCVRSFKVLSIAGKNVKGEHRYLSATPAQSASKAFSKWCKGKASRCSTTIRVQETTRGGKGKTYGYNASRSWNKTNAKLKGKTINFRFSNKLHSQKQHSAKRSKKGGKRTLKKRRV